jgi:hypothetical protein
MTILTSRKVLRVLRFLLAPLVIPTVAHAVTYPFPEKESTPVKAEAAMTVGTKIYLFHSGTEEVRKTINVNDVLTVYREYPPDFSPGSTEAGKVRILFPLGDYYFKGEVVEGVIKPGYLAKKGMVACFITSFKMDSHQQ